jgi:hypothetical protein
MFMFGIAAAMFERRKTLRVTLLGCDFDSAAWSLRDCAKKLSSFAL